MTAKEKLLWEMSDFILDYRTYSGGRSVRLSPTDLRQGGLLEGKKLVDVPVVLKAPAEAEVCFSIQTNSKSFSIFFFLLSSYPPRSLTASSNLFSFMAFCTNLVYVWQQQKKKSMMNPLSVFFIWSEPINQYQMRRDLLTISTHSMSGRRTAWFPDRPMTQAGVSGVASIRAITASTPSLLL